MKNKSEKNIKIVAFCLVFGIMGLMIIGLDILYNYSKVIEQQEEIQEKQLLITCKALCPENTIPYLRTERNIIQELRCLCYDLKINGFIDPFKVRGI